MPRFSPSRRLRQAFIIVTAVIIISIVYTGIRRSDSNGESIADRLQLSSSPHHSQPSTTLSQREVATRERGATLNKVETDSDRAAFNQATYKIKAGFYVSSIYDLDLATPSFSSTGYLWMKWEQPLQDYLIDNKIAINDRVVFLNALLSDSEADIIAVGPEEKLEDGTYYQFFKYTGRFYIDNTDFTKYPFTSVSLPLALEADDIDGVFDYYSLRFIPDSKNSGLSLYAKINGWINKGHTISEYKHSYATNFGNTTSDQNIDGHDSYSMLLYEISLSASHFAGIINLILPLLITTSVLVLIFKIPREYQEARLGIPITVLLALVFLQDGYRKGLPNLAFPTFLDQLYLQGYLLALTSFALAVFLERRRRSIRHLENLNMRLQALRKLTAIEAAWPQISITASILYVAMAWFS
jgi:hypothetical protein